MPLPVHCHFRSIPASGGGVPRHFRCHSLAHFGCAGLATPAPLTTDKTTDLLPAMWIVERTVSSLAGRIALESFWTVVAESGAVAHSTVRWVKLLHPCGVRSAWRGRQPERQHAAASCGWPTRESAGARLGAAGARGRCAVRCGAVLPCRQRWRTLASWSGGPWADAAGCLLGPTMARPWALRARFAGRRQSTRLKCDHVCPRVWWVCCPGTLCLF